MIYWLFFSDQLYGPLPMNQSGERSGAICCCMLSRAWNAEDRGCVGRKRIAITSLTPAQEGDVVYFRARVTTSRAQGSKMVFFNLRQRTDSIQALIVVSPDKVSKQMVKWAGSIADESIVLVEGVVQLPKEEVKSASVSDVEILISQVRRIVNWFQNFKTSSRSPASFTLWLLQTRGWHSQSKTHPDRKGNLKKKTRNLPKCYWRLDWIIGSLICGFVQIMFFDTIPDSICRHKRIKLFSQCNQP